MASFEESMSAACRDGAIAGFVVVATNASGSFTYENAFGQSDQPYKVDSPMKIMSCTKLVVSVCALQCVEKGLISLDDDVRQYVPVLAKQQVILECEEGKDPILEDVKTPITLRLLMTHSAGSSMGVLPGALRNYRARTGTLPVMGRGKGSTVEERYGCPLAFQPGSDWEYGGGHDWAAKVVEALTKTDLDSYIKANVAPQLGITTMTFWPQKNGLLERVPECVIREGNGPLKAPSYDPKAKLLPHPHEAWDDLDSKKDCAGGGGLTCSSPDYLKLLRSLLVNDGKVLKKKTVDAMFVPTLTPEAKKGFNRKHHHGGFKALAPGEYDDNVELDWGLGAALTLADSPGWRGKGTLMWSGLANHFWFVDRQNDLCGMFATQLLPSGDDRVKKLITMWEKEMQKRNKELKATL